MEIEVDSNRTEDSQTLNCRMQEDHVTASERPTVDQKCKDTYPHNTKPLDLEHIEKDCERDKDLSET